MKHRTFVFFKNSYLTMMILALLLMLCAAGIADPSVPEGTGSAVQYELEELVLSRDTIFSGNSVEISWYWPSDAPVDSFERIRLFRADADGNPTECDHDYWEPAEGGGWGYIPFGPEESGVFTFFVSAETSDGGLYEFTSDNTLTVLPHDPATASVVWKDEEGQEITSAAVGQQISAEWAVENVSFYGQGGYARIEWPDG